MTGDILKPSFLNKSYIMCKAKFEFYTTVGVYFLMTNEITMHFKVFG